MEDYFSSLIGKNITGYTQALLPHKVHILEVPEINSDLVKHGFGKHVDTDTFLLLVEMLIEIPLKQNIEPVPDLLIEKPRGEVFCYRPSSLQGYHDILSFCGPKMVAGTKAKVRVTAAVKPMLFYCQMTSMETELRLMSKSLAAICEHRAKHLNQTPETLGQLCSVKGKDGNWYRGFVQFLPVNSHVRVLFIDYGFFESVKVENIHRLPSEFYLKPIMAFPCSLSSVSDKDENDQRLSFLKTGLLGGLLDVEINGFDKEQNLYFLTILGAEVSHLKELEPVQQLPKMKAETVFETEEKSVQGGYLFYEAIMGEMLDKTLQTEKLNEGSVFVGYVEHVLNPNRFWIRTKNRNDDFQDMMTELADHFSQVKLDEEILLDPEPGTLCCAMYEKDMHFYRAVVTDTLKHGAEVFFIDYGNVEKVPYELIKKIPEKFASKSPFAFSCSLVNVSPVNEFWSSENNEFFRHIMSDRTMLVHLLHLTKNRFVVNLCKVGSDNSQSITDLLISSKHAEYLNNIPTEVVLKNMQHWEDLEQQIENAAKGLQEEKAYENEITKDQIVSSFKALNFKPGSEFAVCCSHISSPSDFWCQPLNKVSALEALMDKVQEYYTANTMPFQVGDSCCVANSPMDGKWHRGFITGQQNGHIKVKLVDCGITVQVMHHSLQKIMPEFVELEEQAFRCSLYNLIEPVDPQNCGNWSSEACKSLRNFVQDSSVSLRCKVVSQLNVKNKGLCNVVDLYNAQMQQSLTNILVDQGLAKEVEISTAQPSNICPESFVYSSFDLSAGSVEEVYITHVSSQWEVYCNLDRNTEIIDELHNKVAEESEKMMEANTRDVVRNLCLAKYLDGQWYRGTALPIQSPLHLSVFFVDYGNTSIAEKTSIMFIPRDSVDLLYTPMQAVKFSLASVLKSELYSGIKEWLDQAILNKKVRAVIGGNNDDGSFAVELFHGDVNINEQVKELILSLTPNPKVMVSDCQMKHTPVYKRSQTRTLVKSSNSQPKRPCPYSSSTTSNGHGNSYVTSTSCKKKEAKRSYVSAKAQINKIIKPQMENHKTKTKTEKKRQTDEMPKLSCLPDKKVSAGFRAECYVSHIETVNSFFLQLSEDELAILKMGEDLNSDPFRDSLKTTTSVDLRLNDLVLVEYEEDGALYRSVVKDSERGDCFRVEFLDFGNSAVVRKEKIYSMTKEYLSQPRFSIPCSLKDTSTYINDTAFTDAVMEKPLMVDFVRERGTHWEVNMKILDEATGSPVALEAPVESSSIAEEEVVAPALPADSLETEELIKTNEQSSIIISESKNETKTESENMAIIVKVEKPTLKSLSTKLRSNTCRCYNRKPTRYKNNHNKNTGKQRVASESSDHVGTATSPNIEVRDNENGRVLSVLCNGDFYVRLSKTHNLLVALEGLIAGNLHKCEVLAQAAIKEGLRCLMQGQGDQWHRAVVQHVGQDKYQTFLVDYGITKETTSGSIRELCDDLRKTPDLAVLCRMNNLDIHVGEGTHKLWCETLTQMTGKDVKLVFMSYSQSENVWMVEIVINDLFIQRITTSHQHNEEVIPTPAEAQNVTVEEETSLDGSPPQRLLFTPVHFDEVYFGFAAGVMTPSKFSVLLRDSALMNTVSCMLDDLPEEISPLPEVHLIPGTSCLLKSDLGNKWCRAEIVHADTTVVLNLVDHGHCMDMPYNDCVKLKRIPEELRRLPKVMYPCILKGVKPAGEEWTEDAAGFFQKCLHQKDLQIFFRDLVVDTHWEVDIMVDGVHVAKKLVDAGHARFQEQRPCSEEDSDREGADEDFVEALEDLDGNLNLSAEAASKDEAEGTASLSSVSGHQCVLM
ncbi:hypothetical protein LDENG_00103800 [Lucifuga dentata]|nr:hypothetical protein LDENG_00103800 [Lucifuga dentata]